MSITFDEAEVRMFGVGAMNHRGAKIDAHTHGRLDCREQIALARTQFQDAHAGGNQESIELG